jgi:peroxiredoxin
MSRALMPLIVLAAALPLAAAAPALAGQKALDFALSTSEGKSLRLSDVVSKGPVVLVVLRGYPGYQCPYCNRQVQDFIQKSQGFADAGAHVILVCPGPPQDLNTQANEFLTDKTFPANFDLVLDPGYEFTNQYGLRWDAAQETAYPSTFLIDRQGVVFFSKIVKEHAGLENGERDRRAPQLRQVRDIRKRHRSVDLRVGGLNRNSVSPYFQGFCDLADFERDVLTRTGSRIEF